MALRPPHTAAVSSPMFDAGGLRVVTCVRFGGHARLLADDMAAGLSPLSWAERGRASPDRADALVWALTALLLERGAGPPRVAAL